MLVELGADMTKSGCFRTHDVFQFGPLINLALRIEAGNLQDDFWTNIIDKISSEEIRNEEAKMRSLETEGK